MRAGCVSPRLPIALAVVAAGLLVAAPLVGWPAVVRLDAVVVPALVLAVAAARPWRWDASQWRAAEEWAPTPRLVALGAVSVAAVLFWLVLTRFQSGSINAVDFTVYFDRPCYQTVQGRPLFVETSDVALFSEGTLLALHAFWLLLPVCSVYALFATPIWLLAVSVVAVTAGAVHIFRIMRHLGAGGVLAVATALAFAFNDNTARTLNYGFHAEVLYAWCIPWALDAGLRGQRRSFAAAVVACVLVKENAVLALVAVSAALGLSRWRTMSRADVVLYLLFPAALGLANLAVYFRYVVPSLTPHGIFYTSYWSNYGPTLSSALVGMMRQPVSVMVRVSGSGLWSTVMPPHLFLPLLGWRWAIGLLPAAVIYGASANEQLRAFGVYYSTELVPFLVIGASVGALMLARHFGTRLKGAEAAAAMAVLLGALVAGLGFSVRPWRAEHAAVPAALAQLSDQPVVLVQSELFPHAGYDSRVQMLTPGSLRDPRYAGAAVLLAPNIGAYLIAPTDLDRLRELESITPVPDGLRAVRLPADR
jgi:uncharacterized membrane protein